ncbi:hypothetical protein KUTeg_013204 [Tegillarca granosa]|uniref:Kinesin-like protein n=1 Tax=Tegillarca granosa TaxID=220873 RepID=A0ABQ9ET47_TEGGR|nr:hypothetical protein KUTeg_013204 [Tegillarca granosa]
MNYHYNWSTIDYFLTENHNVNNRMVKIKDCIKKSVELYEIDEDDEGKPRLTFTCPRELTEGYINNKKEAYKFRFEHVFDQSTKQDEIFDIVSKPVIDNVLTGYNGTVFAYGQTGSGKTFTITGGAEKYVDRGIIPRSLSYLFERFESDSERSYSLHVSYLELYNERGYDLLDPKHEAAKLEDLPKVVLMEDSDQNIHLKNLSVHQASTEEEALNLLFLGDTNRMIAETPMNQASTRSHCIFTIHITSRETGSATIRRSKLHLVDLAGSERVSKTGVNGLLLTEAKYINSSLHYLEQESISTCRFAQRVAMIKNEVMINEELDPKLMIQKLKREIQQLKEELAMATGEQRTDALSEEDLEKCEEAVSNFLADTDIDSTLSVGADMRKIQACFQILKRHVLEKPKVVEQVPATVREDVSHHDTGPYSNSENERLKELVIQRDNEISILYFNMSKSMLALSSSLSDGDMTNGDMQRNKTFSRTPSNNSLSSRDKDDQKKAKILGDMSAGRQEAFEIFQRDYEHNDAIKDTKQSLKQRYVDAKTLGQEVNESRHKINHIKAQIEHHRMQLAVQGLIDPNNPEPDEEEQELRNDMEIEKVRYKDCVSKLKRLKGEIEHLQHLLEKSRVKLMKDFELWWAGQAATLQHGGGGGGHMKSAWRTPTPQKSNRQLTDSISQSAPEKPKVAGKIPLTGDPAADADIMAFMKARQRIRKAQDQR